jgi:hypothetical protein
VYRSNDLCLTTINVKMAVVMSQHSCRVMDGGELRVLSETGTVESLNCGCKEPMLPSFNLELFNIIYSTKRGQNK